MQEALDNPFQPSGSDQVGHGQERPLAGLGERFLAKLVDNLLVIVAMLPSLAGILALGVDPEALDSDPMAEPVVLGAVGLMLVLLLALTGVQWFLLATRGQTIGKQVLGIRIVKTDGSPVDFVTAVVLRLWVLGFVTGIANQLCLGWAVTLADVLFIFGEERRCLHDRIASTIVVPADDDA